MNILHVKSIKLTHAMPCVSVVVSGDFCRFKLALPSLLSLSKDEVKASHSDFDAVHAEVVCAPKMLPIGIFLSHTLRSIYWLIRTIG